MRCLVLFPSPIEMRLRALRLLSEAAKLRRIMSCLLDCRNRSFILIFIVCHCSCHVGSNTYIHNHIPPYSLHTYMKALLRAWPIAYACRPLKTKNTLLHHTNVPLRSEFVAAYIPTYIAIKSSGIGPRCHLELRRNSRGPVVSSLSGSPPPGIREAAAKVPVAIALDAPANVVNIQSSSQPHRVPRTAPNHIDTMAIYMRREPHRASVECVEQRASCTVPLLPIR